jgi:hypothetical protein
VPMEGSHMEDDDDLVDTERDPEESSAPDEPLTGDIVRWLGEAG